MEFFTVQSKTNQHLTYLSYQNSIYRNKFQSAIGTCCNHLDRFFRSYHVVQYFSVRIRELNQLSTGVFMMRAGPKQQPSPAPSKPPGGFTKPDKPDTTIRIPPPPKIETKIPSLPPYIKK